MTSGGWRELLHGAPLAQGVEEVLDAMCAAGWVPRKRYGQYGVVLWRDGQRRYQYTITIIFPINYDKLEHILEHTGLDLRSMVDQSEGGDA